MGTMMSFFRDGWEGEPKRTINAFTFQVNITKATSVNTILMIVVITSFVINAIYYAFILGPQGFLFALGKSLKPRVA